MPDTFEEPHSSAMEIDWGSKQKHTRAQLEALDRERRRRDADPLLLCKLITKWPKTSFLLTLLGHLSMLVLTGILYSSGYDILPLVLDTIPLRLVNEPWEARWYAWKDRTKFGGFYAHGGTGAVFRTSDSWFATLDLYYENTHGENVFTKSSMMTMKQLEDELMDATDYDKFCKLDAQSRQCLKPLSILRYFDGTFSDVSTIFNDTDFDNIKVVLYNAYTNNATRERFEFFLAKDFKVTHDEVTSPLTRSIVYFGTPHETLTGLKEFETASEVYSGKTIQPILKRYESLAEVKLSYFSRALFRASAVSQAFKDIFWAGASMLFIFCIILLHTRSLWIAGLAVFSICTCFCTGNLIYNLVFGFKYIGYFHILALFIILGIGADDIFVFYDIWCNSQFEQYLSVAHRLSDTYKRSVISMLFTTLTTAVAFLSCAITPLLATRSFGLFSALVVLVNYCSVVIYFPTVVIMYHLYFENFTWPCCYPCRHKPEMEHPKDNLDVELTNMMNASSEDTTTAEIHTTRVCESSQPIKRFNKRSISVRFFRNYYFRFVTNKYARWVILLVLAGVLAFFSYKASMIEPDNVLYKMMADDNPFIVAIGYKHNAFVRHLGQGELLSVYLIFGMKANDLTSCHFSDPVCTGQQEWDKNFNPNTVEAQAALMALCDRLRTLPDDEANELRIQKSPLTGTYNVECFMDNLQTFLKEESQRTGDNCSLPFSDEKVLNFTTNRPQFFNASVFTADFNNNLEIPISYWLTNRYTGEHTQDFYTFDKLIGEEIGPFSSHVKTNKEIMYGNNLKFVAISVGTTLQAMLLGYEEGDPILENWERFMKKQLSNMPDGLNIGFQVSSHERWVWITRQRLIVYNAIYGIVIGLSLACPIFIIATGNLITGLLATLSLLCCTTCVIGAIVVGGWKIGMNEGVNLCMVVGLSVDYVVHLAEGYTLSLHHDRLSRVRDMLDLMGTSVFFGACTTLGAAVIMRFTVLMFFKQFGVFLFTTIAFSLLFSMGLFVTLMGVIGPEENIGDITKNTFVRVYRSVRRNLREIWQPCVENIYE